MINNIKLKKFFIIFVLSTIIGSLGIYLLIFDTNNINIYEQEPVVKRVSLITNERKSIAINSNYEFTSDNISIGDVRRDHIYLRFDNKINGNESLDNFRKYLQLENTVISVGGITEFDKSVNDNLNVEFISYENGRLKGVLTTIAKESSRQIVNNDDPNCVTDDMIGICYSKTAINTKLIIDFEVQVK